MQIDPAQVLERHLVTFQPVRPVVAARRQAFRRMHERQQLRVDRRPVVRLLTEEIGNLVERRAERQQAGEFLEWRWWPDVLEAPVAREQVERIEGDDAAERMPHYDD